MIRDFFLCGMKRDIENGLLTGLPGPQLELGPGHNPTPGVGEYLDLPTWDAECDEIPFEDEYFSVIHAYHFFEHIQNVEFCLKECQRVLRKNGVINLCVPWYRSQIAYQDLDHTHFFTENTWNITFKNKYYKKGIWRLKCNWQIIVGLEERNMVILAQLLKT